MYIYSNICIYILIYIYIHLYICTHIIVVIDYNTLHPELYNEYLSGRRKWRIWPRPPKKWWESPVEHTVMHCWYHALPGNLRWRWKITTFYRRIVELSHPIATWPERTSPGGQHISRSFHLARECTAAVPATRHGKTLVVWIEIWQSSFHPGSLANVPKCCHRWHLGIVNTRPIFGACKVNHLRLMLALVGSPRTPTLGWPTHLGRVRDTSSNLWVPVLRDFAGSISCFNFALGWFWWSSPWIFNI